jgi:dTDP-4-dehydrorhamnose 3,5-epimerase
MIFRETPLAGAWVLEPERFEDERGFFARTFCRREFEARGMEPAVAQCSVSYNHRRGTLRGLHFQADPHEETKLVRVTRGAVWDVIVDLRPESPTFRHHFAVVLDAGRGNQLFIPRGMAHGFQTLEDATEVSYQISAFYAPESASGYRWDDPTFAIPWPDPPKVISTKDLNLPFFSPSPGEGGGRERERGPGGEGPGGGR